MGNSHSTPHTARRRSFMKDEFIFPQPLWDLYDDWEIYHVEIELKILPPHVRDRIQVRVDEYTQEIISSEDELCPGGHRDPRYDDEESELCVVGESASGGFCLQWNLSLEDLCSQDGENFALCLQDDENLESCLQDNGKLELRLQDDDILDMVQQGEENLESFQRDNGNLELFLQGDDILDTVQQDDENLELCLQDDEKMELCWEDVDELEWCVREDCGLSKRCLCGNDPINEDKIRPQDNEIFTSVPRSQGIHNGGYGGREENMDMKDSSPDCPQSNQELPPSCRPESPSGLFWLVQKWLPSRSGKLSASSDQKQKSDFSVTDSSPSSSAKDIPKARRREPWQTTGTARVNPRTRRLSCDSSTTRTRASASRSGTSLLRRKHTVSVSEPIPMLKTRTTTAASKTPTISKKRKFSLKDEPGWIPNPLDSESDSSDFEDSGIFSDKTGSPGLSVSPSGFLPASWLAQKRAVLLSDRKRCNSEPTPVTPSTTSSSATFRQNGQDLASREQTRSTSTSDDSLGKKPESKWSLVKSSWRRFKPQTADNLALPSSSPEEDEVDLDEQLEWLTRMTDSSQQSQDTESSSEEPDVDPHPPEDVGNAGNIHPADSVQNENPDRSQVVRSSLPAEQTRRPFDHELELDWLCEPEWNNFELELFWSVLRPYLEQLLEDGDPADFPDPCLTICSMDSRDHKMLDR